MTKRTLLAATAMFAALAASSTSVRAQSSYTFFSFPNATQDGQFPFSGLLDLNGHLYGTTYSGGTSNLGTIYETDESLSAYKVLYSFGLNDGANPTCATLIARNGILYGTTNAGGTTSLGTVFSFDLKTRAFRVLHTFGGVDGAKPSQGLVFDNGRLYGTTELGGASDQGTVFTIDPASGQETVLHSFGGADGRTPMGGQLVPRNGVLYGTTMNGGASGFGTVFAVDLTTNTETILHSFDLSDGGYPEGGVLLLDNKLYGTTSQGGKVGAGVVFSVNLSNNRETIVHSFQSGAGGPGPGVDGANPLYSLAYRSGTLYGTTTNGGAYFFGTVFSVDPKTGTENVLHAFNYSDGGLPGDLIVRGSNLIGVASHGGVEGVGVIFSMLP